MDEQGTPSETAPLKVLQAMIETGPGGSEAMDRLFHELQQAALAGHALDLLRRSGAGRGWEAFRLRLKAEAERLRERRMSRWQVDPDRVTLRVRFKAAGAACSLHPPALAGALAKAFLDADLPLAMGLEKTPRPAVHLAHPLPLDVPGLEEWADAVFLHAPEGNLAGLPARINPWAPAGLEILECLRVPNYATPASDLCRLAAWRWSCPPERAEDAHRKVDAFLASERFELVKSGKTGGQKGVKHIEIRSRVASMAWDGEDLAFATRIEPGQALNPRKLLAAILGEAPEAVTGLVRTGLTLAEDPRMADPDRYEPKLHNMFEDAVLLAGSSNITIVDGDDDEPIVLGG